MKVCLIGVSGWAEVIYRDLLHLHSEGKARIVAATVINQAEEEEKCAHLRGVGCPLFDDYREMLAAVGTGAEICFIPTGIHLHGTMTIDALRAGMNVFVEKPAAATIDEVRAMQAAERETGRFVAVGFQSVFAREASTMKRMVLDGRLGRIWSIRTRCLWPRDDAYYARNDWAGQLSLGERWVLDSPFNNAAAHQLNMICFLAGKDLHRTAALESVTAELYRAGDIEAPDTACLEIATVNGPPLYFYATHACGKNLDPVIEIRGERATLTWKHDESLILRDHMGTTETFQVQPEWPRNHIYQTLSDRLFDPRTFICDLEIAAAQTVCANGAHESSRLRSVPEEHLRRELGLTSIEGIEDLVDLAYTDEISFSSADAPWAWPGREVSLVGYERFSGPRG